MVSSPAPAFSSPALSQFGGHGDLRGSDGLGTLETLPPLESQVKNAAVLESGLEALRNTADAGVTLCYRSDLLGPLSAAQTHEFALYAHILSPLEVLRSTTVNPARMMGRAESTGQVKQGFLADLVVLGENPLEDVSVFDRPEECVLGIVKDGRVCKSRWEALPEDSEIPVRV